MSEDTTRTPAALCWHCDRMLDAASAIEGHDAPGPGDVSLCMYCGAVGVFDDALVLVRPTKELLDDLAENREFRQMFGRFSWGRQYLMLKDSLMRPAGEGPDR
jgi:hypothetical protein